MIKKILLMTVFLTVATPEKINTRNDDAQTAAIVVGAVGLVGTAAYWAMRESNASVVARAKDLVEQHNLLLARVDACLQQEYDFLVSDVIVEQANINTLHNQLLASYNQLLAVFGKINARYSSSLTPWNWSKAMLEMRNTLKPLITNTEIKIQELKLLLDTTTYLCKLASYKKALQPIVVFIANNKPLLQQRVFACDSMQGLEMIFGQKKSIQKDLNHFFDRYKDLDNELEQVEYSIHQTDRDSQTEREFAILCQQALFLYYIVKYSDCIVHINNEAVLIREARKVIGAASYPVKDFVDGLKHDINKLLDSSMVSFDEYAQFCVDVLQDLKNTIVASNEYIAERRAHEIYLEQKRQAEAAAKAAQAAQEAADAARRQARAAQEAADAASRQARAAEEQNRLKIEENRISQERNNIERNNQQANRNNNNRW
jgi:hypothetical protein